MSELISWAKDELKLIGESDIYGNMVNEAVLEVLEVLDRQNHSGMSASIVGAILHKLWSFKPLTPLTGKDDEWRDVGGQYQNKRCSSVFKDKVTGKAHYLDGRVFVEPDGSTFTCGLSSVDIDFPFTVPDKPVYVYLKYSTLNKDVKEQWRDGDYEIKES